MININMDKLDEALLVVESNVIFKGEFLTIKNVLLEAKALQTEHEALKKDFARFLELLEKPFELTTDEDYKEMEILDQEIRKKIGKKE